MAEAGIEDILMTSNILGRHKLSRLAENFPGVQSKPLRNETRVIPTCTDHPHIVIAGPDPAIQGTSSALAALDARLKAGHDVSHLSCNLVLERYPFSSTQSRHASEGWHPIGTHRQTIIRIGPQP